MKDLEKKTCRIGLVQAEPVLFDKQASLEKSLEYIDEAAANGAEFIVFPIVWVFHSKMRTGHHIAIIRFNHRAGSIRIDFHHVEIALLVHHVVKARKPRGQMQGIVLLQIRNQLWRYLQIRQKIIPTLLADSHCPLKCPKQDTTDIAQFLRQFQTYLFHTFRRIFIRITFIFHKREYLPI